MAKMRPDYASSNSYSTISTRGVRERMGGVGREIDKIIALNGSDTDKLKVKGVVISIMGEIDSIPAFAHPWYSSEHCIIDARAYVNRDGSVKNFSEYALLERRAIAEWNWAKDAVEFGSQADFITDVFASWFANGIGKKMNMTALENQQLRVLAAIYYLRMLHRQSGLSVDEAELTIMKTLPRILSVPATVVSDVIDACGKEDIHVLYAYEPVDKEAWRTGDYLQHLAHCFNKVTDNAYRLDNSVIFVSLTRGAFVAANAPEIVAVAIEHPPAMFVLAWYSLQKGIHGKTTLGITALGLARRHDTEKFNNFMASMFNNTTV